MVVKMDCQDIRTSSWLDTLEFFKEFATVGLNTERGFAMVTPLGG